MANLMLSRSVLARARPKRRSAMGLVLAFGSPLESTSHVAMLAGRSTATVGRWERISRIWQIPLATSNLELLDETEARTALVRIQKCVGCAAVPRHGLRELQGIIARRVLLTLDNLRKGSKIGFELPEDIVRRWRRWIVTPWAGRDEC